MKKIFILLAFVFILVFLVSCELLANDLSVAIDRFAENYDEINKLEVGITLAYDDVNMNMNSVVLNDGEISQFTIDVEMEVAEEAYSETQIMYSYESDEKLFLYTKHPLYQNLYYITEEDLGTTSDYDTQFSFFSDTNRFEEVDENVYFANYKLDEIIGSIDSYIDDVFEQFGGSDISSDAMLSDIGITIHLNEQEIDHIEINLSEVYSILISDLYHELTGQSRNINVISTLNMKMLHVSNVSIELPTNVISNTFTSNTPTIELNTDINGTLNHQFAQDNFKLVITEEGLYHFDVISDLGLLFLVQDPDHLDDFSFENAYLSSIELNSRVLDLSPGEYFISCLNIDPEEIDKTYSFHVSLLDVDDDYDWDVSYDSQKDADITSYGSFRLTNDFSGDIDTIYFPWYEMQNAVLKVPKGLEILDMQNMRITGYLESDDFDYYVIRFKNPDSLQRYTWSLTFIHTEPESYHTFTLYDAYCDYDSSGYMLGTLTTTNELIIFAFQFDYIILTVSTEGDYQINVEKTEDDATFSVNIYTDTNPANYIGSMSEYNDLTLHLEPGRYYLYPSSNWSSLALFKISISKIN